MRLTCMFRCNTFKKERKCFYESSRKLLDFHIKICFLKSRYDERLHMHSIAVSYLELSVTTEKERKSPKKRKTFTGNMSIKHFGELSKKCAYFTLHFHERFAFYFATGTKSLMCGLFYYSGSSSVIFPFRSFIHSKSPLKWIALNPPFGGRY